MKKKIVFLGLCNYGSKYQQTKHNLGGQFVSFLGNKHKETEWIRKKNYKLKTIVVQEGELFIECEFLLLKNFINLSGENLKKFLNLKMVSPDLIVLISDNVAPLGDSDFYYGIPNIGHNGLKDLKKHIKNQEVITFLIGMGEQPKRTKLENWVLSVFSESELRTIDQLYQVLAPEIFPSLALWFNFENDQSINNDHKIAAINSLWRKNTIAARNEIFGEKTKI